MKRLIPYVTPAPSPLDWFIFGIAVIAALCALAALVWFGSEVVQRAADCVAAHQMPAGTP